MPYIEVRHDELERLADEIDTYLARIKKTQNQSCEQVESLVPFWEGEDFLAFKEVWERLGNENSVYVALVEILESHANYLRYAASCYKNAQINAIARASLL